MDETAAGSNVAQSNGPLIDAASFGWIVGIIIVLVSAVLIAVLIYRRFHPASDADNERPMYWNLIIFAVIGALFSVVAMLVVSEQNRNGIALLYLGMIGGYAVSIKELDLAKHELAKLKLEKGLKISNQVPSQIDKTKSNQTKSNQQNSTQPKHTENNEEEEHSS